MRALRHSVGPIVAILLGALLLGYLGVVAYALAIRAGVPPLVAIAAPVAVAGVAIVGLLLLRGD